MAKPKKRAKPKPKPKPKQKRGAVGQEIFAQVEKIVAEHKIPRLTAFKRLSEKTGRRVGTVAANYYRVARQTGAKLRRRGRRSAGRPRGARPAGAGKGSAAKRIAAALQEVAALVRRQETEIARLRKENDRLAEIRRLVRG